MQISMAINSIDIWKHLLLQAISKIVRRNSILNIYKCSCILKRSWTFFVLCNSSSNQAGTPSISFFNSKPPPNLPTSTCNSSNGYSYSSSTTKNWLCRRFRTTHNHSTKDVWWIHANSRLSHLLYLLVAIQIRWLCFFYSGAHIQSTKFTAVMTVIWKTTIAQSIKLIIIIHALKQRRVFCYMTYMVTSVQAFIW